MKKGKNKLILLKDDYELLLKYIYSRMSPLSPEYKTAEQLFEELKNAEIHESSEAVPKDVIRLNSQVEVEELKAKRRMKFQIVPPSQANLGQQLLSVFAPLSVALMGYRKGQMVSWEMPAGTRVFHIKNVVN